MPGNHHAYDAWLAEENRALEVAEGFYGYLSFEHLWSPRTVTTFNDCDVMVVKVKGEFTWHKHDDTDDFFLVLKGHPDIEELARPLQSREVASLLKPFTSLALARAILSLTARLTARMARQASVSCSHAFAAAYFP